MWFFLCFILHAGLCIYQPRMFPVEKEQDASVDLGSETNRFYPGEWWRPGQSSSSLAAESAAPLARWRRARTSGTLAQGTPSLADGL